MINLKLGTRKSWADDLIDKHIVKRDINRHHGFVAPNQRIVPMTYSWIIASCRESVEDFNHMSLYQILDMCEAVELLCCERELYKTITGGYIPQSMQTILDRITKPKGVSMGGEYRCWESLLEYRNQFAWTVLNAALEILHDKYDKKILFLSRVPWEITYKKNPDSREVWNTTIIRVRARFVFETISTSNIL